MLEDSESSNLAQASFNVVGMTLAERVREAIETSDVGVAAVAKACGITPQAIYQWMSGEVLQISGENLVELAEATGFEARWIAREVGPRRKLHPRTEQETQVLLLMQRLTPYQVDLLSKVFDSVADSPEEQ
jgi:transcriptional regulator with XRE-family HTH domain